MVSLKFYDIYNSPISQLIIIGSNKGVEKIIFNKKKLPVKEFDFFKNFEKNDFIFSKLKLQLEKYFKGELKTFDFPHSNLEGTKFQKKVWDEVKKIKYGNLVSYKDIAKKINNPQAVRAVGSAIGKNPLPILIPCHRVICSDLTLGGYASGLDIKKKLLKIEKIRL
jgi:methylated-DNA-[protein]-cysteine S-methyltransferase